jgi:hypothetical protein
MPVLNIEYPENDEDAKVVVKKIALFLESLEK